MTGQFEGGVVKYTGGDSITAGEDSVCVEWNVFPLPEYKNGEGSPVQAWTGSRRLRLLDFKTVGTPRSALRTGRLYPLGSSSRNNFLVLDPRSTVRPEGLYEACPEIKDTKVLNMFIIVAGIVQTFIKSWNQLLYPRII